MPRTKKPTPRLIRTRRRPHPACPAPDSYHSERLHRNLLPYAFPQAEGVTLTLNAPPESIRPGTYFEGLKLGDDELALFIQETHGQRSPSAHLTAMARMAFRHHLKPDKSASLVLNEVNTSLAPNILSNDYLAAFLGILDLRTNQFRFATAGCRGTLVRADAKETPQPLEAPGGFLGIFERWTFGQVTLTLNSGDKVCIPLSGISSGKKARCRAPEIDLAVHRPGRIEKYLRLAGLAPTPTLFMRTLRNFEQMKEIINWSMAEIDRMGYPLKFQKNFRLVLLELLTNAIIHGNGYDPQKKVVILSDFSPAGILLAITDEGFGYAPGCLPNPLDPANIGKPHGRGLFIVRHYTDEFRLAGNGNCAILRMARKE